MKTLILITLILTASCATLNRPRMASNTLKIECVKEFTLESRVWVGSWQEADLYMCHDDEISIFTSDDNSRDSLLTTRGRF